MFETCARLIWLVPLLPLLGAAVLGIVGSRLSKKAIAVIACATIGVAFLVSAGAAGHVFGHHGDDGHGTTVIVNVWEWLPLGEGHHSPPGSAATLLGNLSIPLGFHLDGLSAVMILVVTGVGFLIHVYASGYMAEDDSYWRFFTYLNLFVSMMLVLVLGSSFLMMFVGWEGVGLCSYLLIGYYYKEEEPPRAGMKAFLVNRVGDFGFLLGMLLILVTFGSLSYEHVLPLAAGSAPFAGSAIAAAIAICLFIGCTGKSAQLPLHVWLPDAMAGPTPVSALIHAATMVTAGVYLIIRANPLFQAAPTVSLVVAIVGGATALFAATIALVQVDIKRVLAYSTVSQLGYMFLAVGVGAYSAGLFHLVTHAFFKALLFLGAGSVSHALNGELDLRKMGGLAEKLPRTRIVMLIATLAIAGIPVLAGFWSKDEILAGVVFSAHPGLANWLLWGGGVLTALLTAFYMFRMYFLAFRGEPRWSEGVHPHESPKVMLYPLYVLAALSAVGGILGLPHWLGVPNLLHDAIHSIVHEGALVHGAHDHALGLTMLLVVVAVAVAAGGSLWAKSWYSKGSEKPARLAERHDFAYRVFRGKYFVDEAYDALIIAPTVRLSRWAATFDRRVVDLAVEGAGITAAVVGEILRGLTSGRVRTYALAVFAGAVFVATWLLMST